MKGLDLFLRGVCLPALTIGALLTTETAAQISDVRVSDSSLTNTLNACGPPRLSQHRVEVISSDACGFTSEFRQILAVDRRLGAVQNITESATATHEIDFDVNVSGPWSLAISHKRVGSLKIRNDGGKCAFASTSGITASGNLPGLGSLSTSTTYSENNCGDNGSSPETAILDQASTVISGNGVTAVTLQFTWSASATSDTAGFPLFNGGDEAILRLGLQTSDGPWNTSCDEAIDGAQYSTAGRGHCVTVRLLEDEPDTEIFESVCIRNLCPPSGICEYRSSGRVNCLGDNYTVLLQYRDEDGFLVCSDLVSVTDGNHDWASSINCACGAVTMDWTVTDAPGFLGGGVASGSVPLTIIGGCVPPGPPLNEACVNPNLASLGLSPFYLPLANTSGNPLDALVCDVGPFGDEQIYQDVWFHFTPSLSQDYDISIVNGGVQSFDSRLAVYAQSTCPDDPANVIACDDDSGIDLNAAVFDVSMTAGTTYLIRAGAFSPSTVTSAAVLLITASSSGETFADLCNGDGGNQLGCTDCPCMNNAPAGTIGGCLNSSGNSTRVIAAGDPSVSLPSGSTSDLRLSLSGAPAGAFCVMLSGNAIAPQSAANPCFGLDSGVQASDRDGLRCAVQSPQRHGGRAANASGLIDDSAGPSRVWGGEASPSVGLASQGGFAAGQTRFFQVTHREAMNLVCQRGLNTSQAVQVTFVP